VTRTRRKLADSSMVRYVASKPTEQDPRTRGSSFPRQFEPIAEKRFDLAAPPGAMPADTASICPARLPSGHRGPTRTPASRPNHSRSRDKYMAHIERIDALRDHAILRALHANPDIGFEKCALGSSPDN